MERAESCSSAMEATCDNARSCAKITLFIPTLEGGGAERMMVNLANAFAARGYSVDLVSASASGVYLHEVRPDIRVIDLGARRVLFSLPGLIRYLRRERPPVLLSALNHANVVALCARMLARTRTRVFVSERNVIRSEFGNRPSFSERVVLTLMRRLYPRADGAIAVANGVAADLVQVIGLDAARVHTIYNPVVTDGLEELASRDTPHPWLEPGEPPVVLGVGRLTAQKDFATLIRAFRLVRDERVCRLVILGEGEERNDLQDLIAELGLTDCVLLPGFQANPFAWMSRAAVFVLSSKWEGLPGVLIQAMACGAPVVSTDCHSGPREILEGGKWGRLVPVADSPKMAAAILEALTASERPDVASRAADFSVPRSVDAYLQVLLP